MLRTLGNGRTRYGVNFGNPFARTSVLGDFSSEKPDYLSWEEYAVFLLESIGLHCPKLRNRYVDRIEIPML